MTAHLTQTSLWNARPKLHVVWHTATCLFETLVLEKYMLFPVLSWQHLFCTILYEKSRCWLQSRKAFIHLMNWCMNFPLDLMLLKLRATAVSAIHIQTWILIRESRILQPESQLYLWAHNTSYLSTGRAKGKTQLFLSICLNYRVSLCDRSMGKEFSL